MPYGPVISRLLELEDWPKLVALNMFVRVNWGLFWGPLCREQQHADESFLTSTSWRRRSLLDPTSSVSSSLVIRSVIIRRGSVGKPSEAIPIQRLSFQVIDNAASNAVNL